MKLLLIAAAAATIAATVPAAAQVAVGVGPGGASVRVGEPRYHDRDWRYRHHDRYSYRDHCRTVRERIVTPSGRVIYKSTRVCR